MKFSYVALLLGSISQGTLGQMSPPPLHPECCKLYTQFPAGQIASFIGISPQQCVAFSSSPNSFPQREDCYTQLGEFWEKMSKSKVNHASLFPVAERGIKFSPTTLCLAAYGIFMIFFYSFFTLWLYHTYLQEEQLLPPPRL